MLQIGISDISKNPAIIDKLDDVAEILNKKTKQVKGIFVPVAFLDNFKEVLEEIEYQKFAKRNAVLKDKSEEDDDTLMDGLDDAY
jgi:protoheme ferro-lyase